MHIHVYVESTNQGASKRLISRLPLRKIELSTLSKSESADTNEENFK